MNKLLKILYSVFPILLIITALEAHVSLDSPTGEATYHSGDIIQIQWTEVVNHGSSVWELYFSPDSGDTWEVIEQEIDQSTLSYEWTVPEISTNKGIIRIVQNNEGDVNYEDQSDVFTIQLVTGIKAKTGNVSGFRFEHPYPNPFNGSVNFSFSVPEPAEVNLRIYDILGREAAVVINSRILAGKHKAVWDAALLPSGTYYAVLKIKDKTFTRRLVYLK